MIVPKKYLKGHLFLINMKSTCPFCRKELSRPIKLKYHIEHSNCASISERERRELLKNLCVPISTIMENILEYVRKQEQSLERTRALAEEVLYLKREVRKQSDEIKWMKRVIERDETLLKEYNSYRHNHEPNSQLDHSNHNHIDQSKTINKDDHSHHIDQSKTITINKDDHHTSNHIDQSNHHVVLNIFGHENIDHIHVPDYLKHQDDIVKLVKDVHFHMNHPENHNVGIDKEVGSIYRKRFRDGKVGWQSYRAEDVLSELIQNGERIMSEYDKPLTRLEENVRRIVTQIIEKETSWNCFTSELSKALKDFVDHYEFKPKKTE